MAEMTIGGCYEPKPDEGPSKGGPGEDSHFIFEEKHTFGLADGVGGWILQGIDSGIYARELMENCVYALSCPFERKEDVNPKRVLEFAYFLTEAEGSSTACIVTLNKNNDGQLYLHAVNVGDSGFMVFRDHYRCVYRSPVQQYTFNQTYRLGKDGDCPDIAQELKVMVQSGDVIVAGTDGLLDNMFPSEIEELLTRYDLAGDKSPKWLARYITDSAMINSLNRALKSPFSMAAKIAGFKGCCNGGKMDDISVIVAKIH